MKESFKKIGRNFLKYKDRKFGNSSKNSCNKYRNRGEKSIYKMKNNRSIKG
jgi:hypothetical protein